MKLAIIADDLTGANDSGVQLAKHGLNTSVLLKKNDKNLKEDVVVFDTDSRDINAKDAEERVKKISKYLIEQGYEFIFKKIDSTMRGNIGSELRGLSKVNRSDFVFIAPGYPNNGRQVIDGYHYVHDTLLHETEIADDPLMPVKESYLPKLLKQQLNEEIGLISDRDIKDGKQHIQTLLENFKEKNIQYIVVDSKDDKDLKNILLQTNDMDYSITYAGSAGLANYLPEILNGTYQKKDLNIHSKEQPVLAVVGSVNINSRNQLDYLLENEDLNVIQVQSEKLVSERSIQEKELKRVYDYITKNYNNGKNSVIYTSGSKEDIRKAQEVGKQNNLTSNQVSYKIVDSLGEVISAIIKDDLFQGLIATGGDTIRSIAENVGISGFYLHDELQTGVPIVSFKEHPEFFCVTKAGGFGDEKIFIDAMNKLRGV